MLHNRRSEHGDWAPIRFEVEVGSTCSQAQERLVAMVQHVYTHGDLYIQVQRPRFHSNCKYNLNTRLKHRTNFGFYVSSFFMILHLMLFLYLHIFSPLTMLRNNSSKSSLDFLMLCMHSLERFCLFLKTQGSLHRTIYFSSLTHISVPKKSGVFDKLESPTPLLARGVH